MYINPMLGKPQNSRAFPSKKCRLHTEIAEITQAFSQLLIGFQVKLPLTKTHHVAHFLPRGWQVMLPWITWYHCSYKTPQRILPAWKLCFFCCWHQTCCHDSGPTLSAPGVQRDVCLGSHEADLGTGVIPCVVHVYPWPFWGGWKGTLRVGRVRNLASGIPATRN